VPIPTILVLAVPYSKHGGVACWIDALSCCFALRLVQRLCTKELAVEEAVGRTVAEMEPAPHRGAVLKHCPPNSGGYTVVEVTGEVRLVSLFCVEAINPIRSWRLLSLLQHFFPLLVSQPLAYRLLKLVVAEGRTGANYDPAIGDLVSN